MEKIKKLKQFFKEEKIDGYIIPKNDEYFCEYTSSHNDRLNCISNFSGSFGFALILKNENYLFVDGRYTLQANYQSGKLFKIITIPNKMPFDILKNKKLIIGFDPKIFTKKTLKIFFKKNSCKLKPLNFNLIDKIWKRKKAVNRKNFYSLPKYSIGDSYNTKIGKILSYMKKRGADFQFITASENNAWLLNIRGKDIKYSPIPHCYVLINKNKEIKIFCDLKKISYSLKKFFFNIKFLKIESIDTVLSDISDKKFIIDRNTCSFYLEEIILQNNQILDFEDPIYNLKAIKSKNEIKNIKKIHIYDGVALTKYLFWVKKNFYKKKIT